MAIFFILCSDIVPRWVKIGLRPSLESLPVDLPGAIHEVIEACWNQKAVKRPSFFGRSNALHFAFI